MLETDTLFQSARCWTFASKQLQHGVGPSIEILHHSACQLATHAGLDQEPQGHLRDSVATIQLDKLPFMYVSTGNVGREAAGETQCHHF